MTITGKGAFVTGSTRTVDWDLFAACGLTWAALQHAWTWGDVDGHVRGGAGGELTRDADALATEFARARARGVDPWIWAWVVPSRVAAYVDRLRADLELLGEAAPCGVVLNLELAEPAGPRGGHRPAWTTGSFVAAERLMIGVRSVWAGEVWITTHGLRVARQPWSAFAAADGVLPQAYNPSGSYDDGFVGRCLASYADDFPDPAARVPLLGANSTPATVMRRFAAEAAGAGARGAAWWAWTGLAASPAKRAEVAACGVCREPPAVA